MSNLGLVLLYKASLWRTSGFLWGNVRQYAELGCKKGWRNKKEVLKHLQSDLARAYRDYNVISGVSVWCQVEVRVYDKKVPGVRMALVARNINSVWPLLCWEWWQCVTHTHTHTHTDVHSNLASQCHWRLRRWPVSTRDNHQRDIRGG